MEVWQVALSLGGLMGFILGGYIYLINKAVEVWQEDD